MSGTLLLPAMASKVKNLETICFLLIFRPGFAQKRYPNGTFAYTDPIDCSPNDKDDNRPCSLQGDNVNGFYESSSWEYSWSARHLSTTASLPV